MAAWSSSSLTSNQMPGKHWFPLSFAPALWWMALGRSRPREAHGTRALVSAALSSSVWLVCKKRPETARPGWDKAVLAEMQANITTRLRDFWDAGIRGPDFVWAATGPALEAYSKYPVVKKADEPGQLLTVTEFLGHVRRMVVEFVVGRVLSGGAEAAAGLDDATTYYLLHRNDFGMDDAPDRRLHPLRHLLRPVGSRPGRSLRSVGAHGRRDGG